MTSSILFVDKLRKRLDSLLGDVGFRVTDFHTEILEVLEYTRYLTQKPKMDILLFNGTENGGVIYGIAKAGKRFNILTTIRLVDPNFDELDFWDSDRWSFSDEAEIELVLDDIYTLVKNHLINWFDKQSKGGT